MTRPRRILERILVPLDGSELARAVLAQVRRILFREDAEVLLVQAVPILPGASPDAVPLAGVLRGQASKYLEEVSAALTSQGARVRAVVRVGNAADVILDVAAEEGATLISMSTHGRSGIARWVLGSVAEKVLRASRVPVLAVRSFVGQTPAGDTELSIRKILVPMDAADLSGEIVTPTAEIAKLFGTEVLLCHVRERADSGAPIPQMTAAYEQFRGAGVPVRLLLREGDPALEILGAAAAEDADLIAMTTHGRAGVTRWMLGSVTEKVLRASAVPLLVVRPAQVQVADVGGRRELEESRA